MRAAILKGIRIVRQADTSSVRQTLFFSVKEQSLAIKLAYNTHRLFRRTVVSSAMVAGYGLKAYLTLARPPQGGEILAVAVYPNEQHQVDYVRRCVHPVSVGSLRLSNALLLCPGSWRDLGRPAQWARYFRVIRALNRSSDFLVACRLASTIGYYLRAAGLLEQLSPRAVLVSSDNNPEAVALKLAAQAANIPVVFIPHAEATMASPALSFALSILDGRAALEAYEQKGAVTGEVIFCGVEGDSRAIDPGAFHRGAPTIGLFPPKIVLWPKLARTIDEARRLFGARELLIRYHPNMLEEPRLHRFLSDMGGVTITPKGGSLADVVRRCHWAIADTNSNVHLSILKGGVPTICVQGLGVRPEECGDLYGFIKNRIVPAALPSLQQLDPSRLAAFYGEGWPERFRHHDASYLDDQRAFDARVREAILALTGHEHAPRHA